MFSFNIHRLTTIYTTIFIVATFTHFSSQTPSNILRNPQLNTPYLPETKFGYNEYSEYPDDDEGSEKGPQAPQWSQLPSRAVSLIHSTLAPVSISEELDSNITWDEKWPSKSIEFGQPSAVSIDPKGNVAVLHRGSRIWGIGTFDVHERYDRTQGGAISENTIILINGAGEKIGEWGKGLFYLPHGLTIDYLGNYWITDVALHQVFKFNAKDVEEEFKIIRKSSAKGNKLTSITIQPALTLGEAFEPGNDQKKFCKPTSVAVQRNGDFFVSDGYCNSRIIKFNERGERILSWGRKWVLQDNLFARQLPMNAFLVPHALALAEDLELIFVADRENGRIISFHSNNGTFHKEYRHRVIGSRIFSVGYAREKIYLVNGPEFGYLKAHVRGFVMDVNSGALLSQFAPGKDIQNPHDIAVSNDGSSIFIVELNPYKVYKFSQEINPTLLQIQNRNNKGIDSISAGTGLSSSIEPVSSHEASSQLLDVSSAKSGIKGGRRSAKTTTATTIILSLVTAAVVLVAMCVAIAAIVARCRKRGCLLLTVRRGMSWESADRRENFKLSNLLESRKGKGGRKFFEKRPNTRDFSKLNTEPETSDDENNLTKII